MNRKSILMLILVFLFAFASIACTPSKKPVPPGPARKPAPTTPAPTTPAPSTTGTAALHQRAMKITNEVDQIKGVKKAHVVLSDNTGYIGLDLDRNLEGSKVDHIKKEAETRAKSMDKSLANIMVTTDVDTVTRIKKVAEGVKGGKPLTSFTKELQEIGRRMTPTTRM